MEYKDYLLLKRIKRSDKLDISNLINKNHSIIIRIGNLAKQSYIVCEKSYWSITLAGLKAVEDYQIHVIESLFTKLITLLAFVVSVISLIISIFIR